MPRPFTFAQARENERFLAILRQTGNARFAAREIGRRNSTMQTRRATHAAFAQDWDAAAAAANAAFHLAGGKRGPEGGTVTRNCPREKKMGTVTSNCPLKKMGTVTSNCPLRTRGGEPVVVRSQNGRLQLRFAHRNKLTKAAEQAFLAALSATANVRLSAAAAGASPAAFYRRRRRDPAFAREFRLALKMGWERLECAALAAGMPESHADDGWRQYDPPPIPPLTADQALQLLWLHEKSVQQGWDLPHRRRRRGEPWETYTERLRAMWTVEQNRVAEDEAVARALRYEETGSWRHPDEAPPPPLPPLHLVTGWSRASGKPPYHEGVALFGGWRIPDMKRKIARGQSI
ncbi:MAG TPA: hypothetical protein VD887_01655 [Allosphingosinicella sp.]|nr:hypothetical protein [Allosphingosinicella sp.]